MSKQKIIVAASVCLVLVAVLFLGYALWKKTGQTKKEEPKQVTNDQEQSDHFKLMAEQIKADICSDSEKPFDVKEISKKSGGPVLFQKIIKSISTNEELANLRGYYFCEGFLKNDIEGACNNELKAKEAVNQCKNGFYFSKMILASLNGEKEKAVRICKSNAGGNDNICKYVGSFEDFKKNDSCSKLPEKEKASCLAIFNEDENVCVNSQDQEGCKKSAAFLRIISGQDEAKCDSLFSLNELDNGDTLCKIKFNKGKDICVDYKYKKFTQSFCEKNN